MSKIGYEEALAENEALKDTIAIVLAQKKVLRKSYDKFREENKKLQREIISLKQDLEVAKDNEIHIETITELREENKKLKAVIAMAEQHYGTDLPFVDEFDTEIKKAKQEAIKEFAERLRKIFIKDIFEFEFTDEEISLKIDNLLKEFEAIK